MKAWQRWPSHKWALHTELAFFHAAAAACSASEASLGEAVWGSLQCCGQGHSEFGKKGRIYHIDALGNRAGQIL